MKVTNQPSSNTAYVEKKGVDRAQGSTDAAKKNISSGTKGEAAVAGSTVEISDNARLMQRAVDVAKQVPDGRAEKIMNLKKSIQNGTYKVDAKAVADKLVDEHLASDFGKNNV